MSQQKKRTAKPNKISTATACAFLTLALLVMFAVGGVIAKYVWGEQEMTAVSSPNFYFTSDLLAETPKTYTLNPGADGSTSFTFEVRNFADKLRVSDDEVSYTIQVTPSDDVVISNSTGNLTSGQKSEQITVSGLKNGQSYTIIATGTAGFVSKLSATVTVKPDAQNIYKNVYENSEDPNYVLLTVWTENVSGGVSITFPSGLIPDNTDAALCGPFTPSNDGTTYKFTDNSNFVQSYSSHVYRFFKMADAKYSEESFTVVISKTDDDTTSSTAVSGVPK